MVIGNFLLGCDVIWFFFRFFFLSESFFCVININLCDVVGIRCVEEKWFFDWIFCVV